MAGLLLVISGTTGSSGSVLATLSSSSTFGFKRGGGTVISLPVTVTVTGGLPPYTYAWTEVGGPSGVAATAPTSSTTRFSAYLTTSPDEVTAQFKCTVTDSLANTADTGDVNITLNTLTDGYDYDFA